VSASYTYYNTSTGAYSTSPLNNSVVAFAFAYDLSQYSLSTTGGLNSASQRLDLYGFPNPDTWSRPATNAAMTAQLNGTLLTGPQLQDNTATKLLSSVALCFASGGTNQSGKIVLSGQGKLDVNLTIYGNKTCA
jgi:hypothetical protein